MKDRTSMNRNMRELFLDYYDMSSMCLAGENNNEEEYKEAFVLLYLNVPAAGERKRRVRVFNHKV